MRSRIILCVLVAWSLLPLEPLVANSVDFQKTIASYNLIGLSKVQSEGWDGTGQTIVVIDDGTKMDHPYLSGVLIDGNCTSRSVCGSDYLKPGIKSGGAHKGNGFHGSMVAGIIAGQANTFAPGGIAPKAKIVSVDNTDGGSEGLIAAMEWVLTIQKKHNVVAVSGSISAPNSSGLRGSEGDCSLDPKLAAKVKELVDAGIVMIFAAGNGGSFSKLDFPACLPEVVSVGALTSKGSIADYSNISKSITVLAPAEILSSNGDRGYFIGGGTSSATPLVAGAVAILKQANPDATPREIKLALQSTKSRISDVLWANLPILNLPIAIEAIQTGKFELKPISPIENATELKAKQEAEAAVKAAAELKAKQEAEAKAAAELKAKQEAEAKASAELKAKQEAETKAAADKAALAKAQSELAAANAALADSQKVNRELQTQLTSVEAQFKLLSDSVSLIQAQVSQLNSKLAAALTGQSVANAKLKKVCSAKPKPKGC